MKTRAEKAQVELAIVDLNGSDGLGVELQVSTELLLIETLGNPWARIVSVTAVAQRQSSGSEGRG